MRTLLWDFTEKCNLRCIHCYNHLNVNKNNDTIYAEEIDDFLVTKLKELEVNHVHLLGGEPLASHKVISFIRSAKENQISISINTNGTLLTEEMSERLIELSVEQIIVSLDGVDARSNDRIRGKGVFEIVISNLKRLIYLKRKYNSKVIVQIAAVVTAINKSSIYKMPFLAKKIGVDVVNLMPVAIRGNAESNMNQLKLTANEYYNVIRKFLKFAAMADIRVQIDCKSIVLKKLGAAEGIDIKSCNTDKCLAGDYIIYMNTEGYIYPCGPLSLKQTSDILPIHIFEENLVEGVNSFKFQLKNYQKKTLIPDICKKCDMFENCNHGTCSCTNDYTLCEIFYSE